MRTCGANNNKNAKTYRTIRLTDIIISRRREMFNYQLYRVCTTCRVAIKKHNKTIRPFASVIRIE